MKSPASSLLAAALGGALLAVAFPPLRLDLIAWIAFIPLFWAMDRASRPSMAAVYGMGFGFAFCLINLNWIYITLVTHGHFARVSAVFLLASLMLSLALFAAAFAYVAGALAERGFSPAITAPFIWTALEWVRATAYFTGFPWDLAGYSQAGREHLAQIADVTGVYGLSFLVVLVNGAFWESWSAWNGHKKLPWRLIVTTTLIIAFAMIYGKMRLNEFSETLTHAKGFRVGILQGNIAQQEKWADHAKEYILLTYEKLGIKACREGAQLLIWPETSVPFIFSMKNMGWKVPGAMSRKLGVPMLVGAASETIVGGESRFYNSAFLLDGALLRNRYDKIHLVPFGEYMPLNWLLPLGSGIAAREADYSPGEGMTVMSVPGCPPFSVLICYEAIFPDLSRRAMRKGAKMLVNITNDAWFGDSAAPYQHLEMARMRSIENRVWLLRSANTGVSAAIDPAGRMVQSIPFNEEGFIVVPVNNPVNTGSFYTSAGDLFAYGCVAVTLFLPALSFRSRRTKAAGDPDC